MIQRIQSLFLLGVVAISVSLFFVPFSEKSTINEVTGEEVLVTLELISNSVDSASAQNTGLFGYVLMLMNLMIMAAASYIIFLFKNRVAQMRLCMFTGLLSGLMLVLVFYLSDKMDGGERVQYLTGTYLIALQVFLLLAARRFIRKDEALVRSAERIR